MDFIIKNSWFIIFIIWGLPLTHYRSQFRKIVYKTDSWLINIKPVFFKEIKALFTNLYPEDKAYQKMRKFYSFYLTIYVVLFLLYVIFGRNALK